MLSTRSSDRKKEKCEMKGTKPHSIVKNSTAAAAAVATKNIISKKNQKQTMDIVRAKSSIPTECAEVGSAAVKTKRFGSTIVTETPAKTGKPFVKNVELMEVKNVKSPKNAPSIKVEIDSEPTANVLSKKPQKLVQTTLWDGNVSSKKQVTVAAQKRHQKIGKSTIIESLEESKPILSSYQIKIQQQKDALHLVEEKVKRSSVIRNKLQKKKSPSKKSKNSSKKSLLREQLKLQLETQRELLRVQQEIFEKANKAQNNIFKLISVLGDDEDDSVDEEDEEYEEEVGEDEEEEEEEEEQGQEEEEVEENVEMQVKEKELEVLETEILETEVLEQEEILGMEPIETEEISNNKYAGPSKYGDSDQMDLVVVVQSDEGVEEFELYEIYEGADGTNEKPKKESDQLHFEIVEGDDQDIHCRVVNKDEQLEYVTPIEFVASNQADPLRSIPQRSANQTKHPIHVNLPEVNVPCAGPKTKPEKTDLLNKSNMSEKQLSGFIQEMIHSAEPNSDGKFQCTICNEVVSNRYSLGPHVMRVHSKHKSKVCPFCDRAFTCTGDLTRHIRIHTNSKPFKCNYPDCDYAFRASGDLHKHLRRHQTVQDGSNRRFTCDLCERSFERNYDLKRHKMTHIRHEEGVGYQCEYCPKTFVRKDQHKAHTYRHLGIKPYKCPDCDRSFGDFSNCSKHIKLNACKDSGDAASVGRFTCDICMKRFKSKAGIKLHVSKCSQQNTLCKEFVG